MPGGTRKRSTRGMAARRPRAGAAGGTAQPDLVAFATGYLVRFPFIDPAHLRQVDRPHLYQHVLSPHHDNPFMAGLVQPDSGQYDPRPLAERGHRQFLQAGQRRPAAAAGFRGVVHRDRHFFDHAPPSAPVHTSTRHCYEVAHMDYPTRPAAHHQSAGAAVTPPSLIRAASGLLLLTSTHDAGPPGGRPDPTPGRLRTRTRAVRPLDWASLHPRPPRRAVVTARGGHRQAAPAGSSVGSGTQPGAGTSTGCGQPPSADTPPAVSLRGHGGSGGGERLSRAGIRDYMHDVVQTIVRLPAQPVLVGHSIGGLVVQRVLERYPVRAGVLISPVPGHSGHRLAHNVTRRYPGDLVRVPRRTRPSKAPILVLGSPDDRLKPLADMRQVAGHYGAELCLFPGWATTSCSTPAGSATGCVAGLGGGHRAEPASGRWREGRGKGERLSLGGPGLSSPSCARANGHPAPVTRSHPSLVTMSGLVYSDSSSRSRVPAKELWWLPGTGRTRWRWRSSRASSSGPMHPPLRGRDDAAFAGEGREHPPELRLALLGRRRPEQAADDHAGGDGARGAAARTHGLTESPTPGAPSWSTGSANCSARPEKEYPGFEAGLSLMPVTATRRRGRPADTARCDCASISRRCVPRTSSLRAKGLPRLFASRASTGRRCCGAELAFVVTLRDDIARGRSTASSSGAATPPPHTGRTPPPHLPLPPHPPRCPAPVPPTTAPHPTRREAPTPQETLKTRCPAGWCDAPCRDRPPPRAHRRHGPRTGAPARAAAIHPEPDRPGPGLTARFAVARHVPSRPGRTPAHPRRR